LTTSLEKFTLGGSMRAFFCGNENQVFTYSGNVEFIRHTLNY
jgi:hypothetical protein